MEICGRVTRGYLTGKWTGTLLNGGKGALEEELVERAVLGKFITFYVRGCNFSEFSMLYTVVSANQFTVFSWSSRTSVATEYLFL